MDTAKNPYGEVAEAEILIGGVYKELEFRTAKEGQEATIDKARTLIQKVAFSKMDILAGSWGKPTLEAALYIGIDPARVETLTEKSFETVIQEGRRLNFTLLQKWLKWNMEAMTATGESERVNQIVEKILKDRMDKELPKSSNS